MSGSNSKAKEYVGRMVRLLEDLKEQNNEIRDLAKEATKNAGLTPAVLKRAAKEQMNPELKTKREAFTDELDQVCLLLGAI